MQAQAQARSFTVKALTSDQTSGQQEQPTLTPLSSTWLCPLPRFRLSPCIVSTSIAMHHSKSSSIFPFRSAPKQSEAAKTKPRSSLDNLVIPGRTRIPTSSHTQPDLTDFLITQGLLNHAMMHPPEDQSCPARSAHQGDNSRDDSLQAESRTSVIRSAASSSSHRVRKRMRAEVVVRPPPRYGSKDFIMVRSPRRPRAQASRNILVPAKAEAQKERPVYDGAYDTRDSGEAVPRQASRMTSTTWSTVSRRVLSESSCSSRRSGASHYREEYNQLADNHGLRRMPELSSEEDEGDTKTSSKAHHGWLARHLFRRTASTYSLKAKTTYKPIARKKSLGGIGSTAPKNTITGKNLEELSRLGGLGLLALPPGFAVDRLSLPTVLAATATYLLQHGYNAPGLFRVSGQTTTINALYEFYDQQFSDGGSPSKVEMTVRSGMLPTHIEHMLPDVASLFKKVLSGLPGGILGSIELFETLTEILDKLGPESDGSGSKQLSLKPKLVALAMYSVTSSYRVCLIQGVLGLVSYFAFEAEKYKAEQPATEDQSRSGSSKSELMSYQSFGVVFGPLLLGDLTERVGVPTPDNLDGATRRSEDNSPKKTSKKQKRNSFPSKLEKDANLTAHVDRANLTANVMQQLLFIWQDVVKHLQEISGSHLVQSRSTSGTNRTRKPSSQPSKLSMKDFDEESELMDILRGRRLPEEFIGPVKMKRKVKISGMSPMSRGAINTGDDDATRTAQNLHHGSSDQHQNHALRREDPGDSADQSEEPSPEILEVTASSQGHEPLLSEREDIPGLTPEHRTHSDIAMDQMAMGTILPPRQGPSDKPDLKEGVRRISSDESEHCSHSPDRHEHKGYDQFRQPLPNYQLGDSQSRLIGTSIRHEQSDHAHANANTSQNRGGGRSHHLEEQDLHNDTPKHLTVGSQYRTVNPRRTDNHSYNEQNLRDPSRLNSSYVAPDENQHHNERRHRHQRSSSDTPTSSEKVGRTPRYGDEPKVRKQRPSLDKPLPSIGHKQRSELSKEELVQAEERGRIMHGHRSHRSDEINALAIRQMSPRTLFPSRHGSPKTATYPLRGSSLTPEMSPRKMTPLDRNSDLEPSSQITIPFHVSRTKETSSENAEDSSRKPIHQKPTTNFPVMGSDDKGNHNAADRDDPGEKAKIQTQSFAAMNEPQKEHQLQGQKEIPLNRVRGNSVKHMAQQFDEASRMSRRDDESSKTNELPRVFAYIHELPTSKDLPDEDPFMAADKVRRMPSDTTPLPQRSPSPPKQTQIPKPVRKIGHERKDSRSPSPVKILTSSTSDILTPKPTGKTQKLSRSPRVSTRGRSSNSTLGLAQETITTPKPNNLHFGEAVIAAMRGIATNGLASTKETGTQDPVVASELTMAETQPDSHDAVSQATRTKDPVGSAKATSQSAERGSTEHSRSLSAEPTFLKLANRDSQVIENPLPKRPISWIYPETPSRSRSPARSEISRINSVLNDPDLVTKHGRHGSINTAMYTRICHLERELEKEREEALVAKRSLEAIREIQKEGGGQEKGNNSSCNEELEAARRALTEWKSRAERAEQQLAGLGRFSRAATNPAFVGSHEFSDDSENSNRQHRSRSVSADRGRSLSARRKSTMVEVKVWTKDNSDLSTGEMEDGEHKCGSGCEH